MDFHHLISAGLPAHPTRLPEDPKFFHARFRSQYADTIRQSKAGSSNEDFEKIGTRFHSWFRDNLGKAGLKAYSPIEFRSFVQDRLRYYLRAYLDIVAAQKSEKPGWEHVFYHHHWGIRRLSRISVDDVSISAR